MDNFCQIIKTLNETGKAAWKRYTLSKTLDLDKGPKTNDASVMSILKQVVAQLTDEVLPDIETYFYAESLNNDDSLTNGYGHEEIETLSENVDVCDNSFHTNTTHSISVQNLVPFSVAQGFLSHLSYCLANGNQTLTKFLPLLVLCDGHVNKRHVYFLLMQAKTDGTMQVPHVTTEAISCHGPYNAKQWDKGSEKPLPRVMSMYCGSNGKNSQGSFVNLSAEYNLFGSSSTLVKDVPSNAAQTIVTVHCSKAHEILSLDPSSVTSIDVKLKPVPGGVESPAFSFYKNLSIIEGLLCAFGPERTVKWIETTEQCKTENITQRLNDVVTSFNETKAMSSPDYNETKSLTDGKDNYIFLPRKELDFTEQVWEVLKSIDNIQDLTLGLEFICKKLELGQGIRFWLHEDNNTFLANLIRKSYEGKISTPFMSEELTIEIMAEIGADKLRRDYTAFFFQNSISATSKLERIISQQNPDAKERLVNLFEGLQKLHHIMELVVHCKEYLKLPPGKVLKIVRSAVQEYLDEKFDVSKVYSFAVVYSDVKNFLEVEDPSVWKVNIKTPSKQPGLTTRSLCWSRDFPLDKLLADTSLDDASLDDVALDDAEESQRSFYYVTQKVESSHL